ncbi:hypothetical protein BHE74_00040239 [Ensete ventricosum]|nr:hypothetical protein BHE74_00040239 [Ensete ventricosum]
MNLVLSPPPLAPNPSMYPPHPRPLVLQSHGSTTSSLWKEAHFHSHNILFTTGSLSLRLVSRLKKSQLTVSMPYRLMPSCAAHHHRSAPALIHRSTSVERPSDSRTWKKAFTVNLHGLLTLPRPSFGDVDLR